MTRQEAEEASKTARFAIQTEAVRLAALRLENAWACLKELYPEGDDWIWGFRDGKIQPLSTGKRSVRYGPIPMSMLRQPDSE